MNNKTIRLQLINIYGNICFLNGVLSKTNYITLHHITKYCITKDTSVENGALLSRFMHENLHFIENYYNNEYNYINDYLRYYKETQDSTERTKMGIYVKKLTKEIKRSM